ncbi:hypothetical protein WJN01_01470 [Flavobacteriaceae bacterium SZ-1-7]|uniref:hypothetical protein n=1 Tax=Tamlana sedimenti TaxID=3134126 RepID=UPI0031254DB4
MKPTKKIILVLLSLVLFACSKDEGKGEDSGQLVQDKLTRYINENKEDRLVSEAFVAEDNATTFVYGKTDALGEIESVSSFAYRQVNSKVTYYILLDDLSRVTEIYSETDGVKNTEVQVFSYPQYGIANSIVKERNWSTGEESIKHFTAVEIDGDNFNAIPILGKSQSAQGVNWNTIKGWLGIGVGIAAAAITIYIAPTVLAGVLAGILFATAASAEEPPLVNTNPNAPIPPLQVADPCVNYSFNVIIGVDPGNVLTAIVTNGNSSNYTFYWSTGDKATTLIGHTITAPDDKTYYVLVVDENGCTAFASSHPYVKPLAWYKGTYTLTPFRTDDTDYSECGTQFDEIGQFYVYLAEIQGKKEAIVYSKSIIEGMPHVYSHASYCSDCTTISQFNKDDSINPRQWREVIGTDPKTGFDIPRFFRMSELRVNEADNSLIADSPSWQGDVGVTGKGVQTSDSNMNCAAYGSNATSNKILLFSYDFIYRLTDVSASYFGLFPPEEITAFDVANMEFILAHKNEGFYHIAVDN